MLYLCACVCVFHPHNFFVCALFLKEIKMIFRSC